MPEHFDDTLGPLPSGVTTRTRMGGEADVIVLFVTKFSSFRTEFAKAMEMMLESGGMLWVAWPKKAAKTDSDLDEGLIRNFGLAAGVVDTKVCAIDDTWSGLRFSRRRVE